MHGPLAYMHVIAALTALASGLFVTLWHKGRALHRLIGLLFAFAMLVTNISALTIYHLTGHFGLFHVLALLSLAYTLGGLALPVLRPQGWLAMHVRWMSWSYLGLLAATLNETLVRLPILHVNTPSRIYTAGALIAAGIAVIGRALQPRLQRATMNFTG
ncbi:MAG TPA: DUF2306 domain-containing protein [Rhizomicrobium sp.]|jgi:uncharacterized membrane protein|nr:DUF2306 domain-containing protein [Rhizomicrobium sp.]